MMTNFSSDTLPEVPPAVSEFVQNLSGGRFINDVYIFSSEEIYNERCEIVGGALIAGIQRVVPLIVERLGIR